MHQLDKVKITHYKKGSSNKMAKRQITTEDRFINIRYKLPKDFRSFYITLLKADFKTCRSIK